MNSEELKHILKTGEEQFDSLAWEKMSRKLDILMPVKKVSFFSPKNLILSGAAAVAIVAGIYVSINNTQSKKELISSDNTDKTSSIKKENENQVISEKSTESSNSSQNISEEKLNLSRSEDLKNQDGFSSDTKNTLLPGLPIYANENQDKKQAENKQIIIENQEKYVLPNVQKFYCQNEEITLKNDNSSSSLDIFDDTDNMEVSILPNQSKTFKLKKACKYNFRHPKFDGGHSNFSFVHAFEIISAKTVDFSFENELIYEKGLPYINLSAKDFTSNSSWKANKGLIVDQTENTKLRVLNKGKYDVSLNFVDENSCKSTKTETISIEEEYNLMAPSGFRPLDLDARTNRFIPFALTKRNVQFEMIIVDPQTSRIVFKSNSAENAWDGIDMNSGELVFVNKLFIWKVILKNPEPKEKSEYTGTIVRL